MNRVAVLVATVGGLGYAPIAPGTFGSAAGILIYWATRGWPMSWQLALIAAVSGFGIWASTRAAAHFGKDDPGAVVVDEVAGQLVTLAFTGASGVGMLAGFLIFRALDIVKPYPANRFESLHGGLGIMADDLMAGVYGCLLMHGLTWMLPALGR